MVSVFVVDDHPIVAMAIRLALVGAEDLFFSGFSTRSDEALKKIARTRPDVLILDLVLDKSPDIAFVERCRWTCPNAAILVFSSLADIEWTASATKAGADEVVSKAREVEVLIERIRAILISRSDRIEAGETRRIAIGAGTTHKHAMGLDHRPIASGELGVRLTRREAEIAVGLSQGASIQAIAHALAISGKTVAAHRDNLRLKLQCRSTSELIAHLARSL